MLYRLDERALLWRARWIAVLGSGATLAPSLLVVVLATKLDYAPERIAWIIAVVLLVLAVARGFAAFAQARRRLRAFSVKTDDEGVLISAMRGEIRLRFADVKRVREIEGALGGLRVEAAVAGEEMVLDLPRGGESFGELRAVFSGITPVERATRRGRWFRIGLGTAVVLSIFFVPFMLDDLAGRSRLGAVALVALVWVGMLLLRRRA